MSTTQLLDPLFLSFIQVLLKQFSRNCLQHVMSLMGSPASWVRADLGCHEVVAVFFFAKVEFGVVKLV
jgi:hypothetical protein